MGNKRKTLKRLNTLLDLFQVRIMFEVQDLRFATLATVSRCGMVWFSEDVLSTEMIFENYLQRLSKIPIEEAEEEVRRVRIPQEEDALSPSMQASAFPRKP